MNKNISISQIKKYKKEFDSCMHCKTSMNALTRSKLEDVTMDWESFRKIDHNYSHVIKHEMPKVTNQKASGRCWGFAALNLMRIEFSKKYNLSNFEFSQSYFMFLNLKEHRECISLNITL